MRRELTSAERMKLDTLIDETAAVTPQEKYDLIDMFVSFYAEQNTFMDAIHSAENPRIWRTHFRKEWGQCLVIMQEQGRPLTSVMIARILGEKLGNDPDVKDPYFKAREACRHLVDARYWNIIEKTGEKKGNADYYRLTSYGRNALAKPNQTLVKNFVYTIGGRVVPTPDGKNEPEIVPLSSVSYFEDRTYDEHVRDSSKLSEQRQPSLFV